MDFIDTHLHLIARDKLGYGWTAGIPALAEGDFTLADYTALTAGRGVVGALFMETGVDDADYQAEARLVAWLVGAEAGFWVRSPPAGPRRTQASRPGWTNATACTSTGFDASCT